MNNTFDKFMLSFFIFKKFSAEFLSLEKDKNDLENTIQLGKSIFVGDRLQNNLRVLTHVSIVTAALGMVLVIMDILRGEELVLLIAACATFLGGVFCAYFAHVRRNRRIAAMIPTAFCIIAFTIYAVTGMGQGTAIYWTLMMPIGISYFVGVRADILLSAYYSVLFCIIFYVPSIRAHMAQYYSEAFMTRFPLLFIALAIFTLIAMVQYHRMARRDIEYADRLNAEVEKQTAVARERADKLALMSEEMVRMMAVSIDAKDRYTNGHSNRVAAYSAALADALGWTKEECYTLWKEALLHDIGKIGIPDIVLNKPGRLTDDEFRIIKSHTTIGGRILREQLRPVGRSGRGAVSPREVGWQRLSCRACGGQHPGPCAYCFDRGRL